MCQQYTGRETPPIAHAGQEFAYCVSGKISYQIGNDTYSLEQGDSLLFVASQPHRFFNTSPLPPLILLVFQAQEGSGGAPGASRRKEPRHENHHPPADHSTVLRSSGQRPGLPNGYHGGAG
ncbi:MAG: cupin domain-containing protein [Anaerolineae bacterium]|nr:cupin domain-containing protein [Anaerolineae bacterium]